MPWSGNVLRPLGNELVPLVQDSILGNTAMSWKKTETLEMRNLEMSAQKGFTFINRVASKGFPSVFTLVLKTVLSFQRPVFASQVLRPPVLGWLVTYQGSLIRDVCPWG